VFQLLLTLIFIFIFRPGFILVFIFILIWILFSFEEARVWHSSYDKSIYIVLQGFSLGSALWIPIATPMLIPKFGTN